LVISAQQNVSFYQWLSSESDYIFEGKIIESSSQWNSAFGANVATQVSITPAIGGYVFSKFDEAANTLKIVAENTIGNNAPLESGLTPVKLMTVAILAQDCTESADFEWNSLTSNGTHTYEENGNVFQYMNVSYTGDFMEDMCGCDMDDPEITGFSETQVRAGTGEVLTIFGDHFGNIIVEDDCYIEVDNADHIFPTNITPPEWTDEDRTRIPIIDIIDWKNDEITFIVPSTTLGNTKAPMETGHVRVFTECDKSNNETIDVEYAVLNYRPGTNSPANRVALEKQTVDGIEFKYSNLDATEASVVTYAINTWCAETNIRWFHGGAASGPNIDPNDNENVVISVDPDGPMGAFVGNGSALASVVRKGVGGVEYVDECGMPSVYYIKNIDVVINEDAGFDNMSLSDARNVLLHEFGHAHNMEHAALTTFATQQLMFYAPTTNVEFTSADKAGAQSVFAASTNLLNNCTNLNGIDMGNCSNATEDKEIEQSIEVTPIPFFDILNIDFKKSLPSDTYLNIYSSMGGLVKRVEVSGKTQIKLDNLLYLYLTSGLYLIEIRGATFHWAQKAIKI
jgi:hypothetical protein